MMVKTQSAEKYEIDTILNSDVTFKGEMHLANTCWIHGTIKGTINSKRHIHIGKKANIDATIKTHSITIKGSANGEFIAYEQTVICSGANVQGKITSADIITQSGANINGSISMPLQNAKKNKSDLP